MLLILWKILELLKYIEVVVVVLKLNFGEWKIKICIFLCELFNWKEKLLSVYLVI